MSDGLDTGIDEQDEIAMGFRKPDGTPVDIGVPEHGEKTADASVEDIQAPYDVAPASESAPVEIPVESPMIRDQPDQAPNQLEQSPDQTVLEPQRPYPQPRQLDTQNALETDDQIPASTNFSRDATATKVIPTPEKPVPESQSATAAEKSYISRMAAEAKQPAPFELTKDQAAKKIAELEKETGRENTNTGP